GRDDGARVPSRPPGGALRDRAGLEARREARALDAQFGIADRGGETARCALARAAEKTAVVVLSRGRRRSCRLPSVSLPSSAAACRAARAAHARRVRGGRSFALPVRGEDHTIVPAAGGEGG